MNEEYLTPRSFPEARSSKADDLAAPVPFSPLPALEGLQRAVTCETITGKADTEAFLPLNSVISESEKLPLEDESDQPTEPRLPRIVLNQQKPLPEPDEDNQPTEPRLPRIVLNQRQPLPEPDENDQPTEPRLPRIVLKDQQTRHEVAPAAELAQPIVAEGTFLDDPTPGQRKLPYTRPALSDIISALRKRIQEKSTHIIWPALPDTARRISTMRGLQKSIQLQRAHIVWPALPAWPKPFSIISARQKSIQQKRAHIVTHTLPDTVRRGSKRIYLPPLKKQARPRHVRLRPYIILLLALVLGSTVLWGIYGLASYTLTPLTHLFEPLNGDLDGVIGGQSWNLLLLGSDNDKKFTFPGVLTQMIMVVHIDPQNRRVSMVSLPRDSWVPVPGYTGSHKIDQAFYMGAKVHHNFADGVQLARSTIEQDYGIPIDRYAWVGLDGFARVIDTLGGLDVDLTHPLEDDAYPDDTGKNSHTPYAMRRIYLAPGPQHLSGEEVLEYIRSRHADLIGDIGRTQRQQEVLAALKVKIQSSGLLQHLPELWNDMQGNVRTDLSQSELLSLANFGRNLPAHAIQSLTLGPGNGSKNYGTLARVKDPGLDEDQDVIQPDCTNILPVLNSIFGAASCQIGSP